MIAVTAAGVTLAEGDTVRAGSTLTVKMVGWQVPFICRVMPSAAVWV